MNYTAKERRIRQTKRDFPRLRAHFTAITLTAVIRSPVRLRRFKDLFSIFLRDLTMPCYFYATVGIILRREALNISTKE